MAFIESFTPPQEDALVAEFLRQGYVIRDVDRRDVLDSLRHTVVELACGHLSVPLPDNEADFLNHIHKTVAVQKLNDLRMAIYNRLNATPWFRPTYFGLGRSAVGALAGNELAMQNKVNLSIQFPEDDSSLLGLHADAWSGESPFQMVQWLPLVDVSDTKSMYITKPEMNRVLAPKMKEAARDGGSQRIFEQYREHFSWLRVPYGKALFFSPTLMHGNIVNKTTETRWSMNSRYKGLFTPYTSDEKGLGNFYLPITARAISRVGMNYRRPEGFE